MISKVISGGAFGADQAGLDAAIELRIPHGGWITRGKTIEGALLPEKYKLREMGSNDYEKQAELNVLDAEGSLIFTNGIFTKEAALTLKFSIIHKRPYQHINFDKYTPPELPYTLCNWLAENNIHILNISGSRILQDTGIYDKTKCLLTSVFLRLPEIELKNKPLAGIQKKRSGCMSADEIFAVLNKLDHEYQKKITSQQNAVLKH